jgi:hypothetical protein
MNSIEIHLIELGEVKNVWFRDFLVLISEGHGQRHVFVYYENYDQLYGIYKYYQYYFN